MSNYIVGFVALAILSIGLFVALNDKPFEVVSFAQPAENFGGTKFSGALPSVGVLIKDAANADAMLSEFVINKDEVPCDPTATSTPSPMCASIVVTYKGEPVSVYAIVSQDEVDKHTSELLATFPFAGQLTYKNIEDADVDRRLVKLMEEKNTAGYTILYDTK